MNAARPYSMRLDRPAESHVHVAFVGAGPGDPGLMTVRAREYLAEADTVILDLTTTEDVVVRYARPDVRIIASEKLDYGEFNAAVRTRILLEAISDLRGRDVTSGLIVRLMDGDPALFGGLLDEALVCRQAGVGFDIVPGVTAIAAVPTYAGVPLTSGTVSAVHICSSTDLNHDWSSAVDDSISLVILGCAHLREALANLVTAGRDPKTQVALVERGTTVDQATHVFELGRAGDFLARNEVSDWAVAVVSTTVAERSHMSWFETKPLFGWKVLVPRTKDQAGPTVERLASFGAIASVVPTIAVEPPRTPQRMERAVKDLVTGRYEWVGFTSANAVKAVREKFDEFGLDARTFAGVKVAAVGGTTAAALRGWGINPDLVPDVEESAAGLLAVWPEFDPDLDPINGVFLPRADIATDTLVAGLHELGWEVDDVTAYRTVRAAPPPAPIREAIKAGRFDAVLFTSSSTVRNLIGIAGKPHPATVVACIGPATAQTARDHGLTVHVIPEHATGTALVDALADYGENLARQSLAAGRAVVRPSARRRRRSAT